MKHVTEATGPRNHCDVAADIHCHRDDASGIRAKDAKPDGKEKKNVTTTPDQPEPEASTGEGDLSSDQGAVNCATEDEGAFQDEANLLT